MVTTMAASSQEVGESHCHLVRMLTFGGRFWEACWSANLAKRFGVRLFLLPLSDSLRKLEPLMHIRKRQKEQPHSKTLREARCRHKFRRSFALVLLSLGLQFGGLAAEQTEHFDRDPLWDGHNNRTSHPSRHVRQDFGYSKGSHTGGASGEIGGFITAAAEPAYYAKPIPERSFDDTLSA